MREGKRETEAKDEESEMEEETMREGKRETEKRREKRVKWRKREMEWVVRNGESK